MTDHAVEHKFDFDAQSQKGWTFFTKFIAVNMVVTIAILALLAVIFSWH